MGRNILIPAILILCPLALILAVLGFSFYANHDIQEITITIPAGSTLESPCSEDYFYWGVYFSSVRNSITVSSIRLTKE